MSVRWTGRRGRWATAAALVAVVAFGACSAQTATTTGDGATTGTTSTGTPTGSGGTTTGTGATTTGTVATTGTSVAGSTGGTRTGMRGERYCEVLLVDVTDGQATAQVFVSYPLNDCPAESFDALDTKAIAAAEGTTAAVLNGPRHWLMDKIEKESSDAAPVIQDFGGIEMQRQATVQIGSLAEASTPYRVHEVNRSTIFSYDAGQTVYELHAPDGATYVMQSWSQQKDPTLTEADLAGLGSRLQLPAGWSYAERTLDEALVVDTTAAPARVLQDELANSYSFTG